MYRKRSRSVQLEMRQSTFDSDHSRDVLIHVQLFALKHETTTLRPPFKPVVHTPTDCPTSSETADGRYSTRIVWNPPHGAESYPARPRHAESCCCVRSTRGAIVLHKSRREHVQLVMAANGTDGRAPAYKPGLCFQWTCFCICVVYFCSDSSCRIVD